MHNDLIIASLWLLITALQCYQWYWQGRRDQMRQDKQIFDNFVNKVEDVFERHKIDPTRPSYLDRQ